MAREVRNIDTTKGIIDYIQRNLKKGYKLEQLKWALINQGYSRIEVDKAVKYITEIEEAQKVKKVEEIKPEVMQEPIRFEEKKSGWKRFKERFLG